MEIFIKPDNSSFVWLHRITDLFIPLALLMLIAHSLKIPWHDRYTILGILGGLIFITSAQMVGIYQNWRGRTITTSINLIIRAWFLAWSTLIIFAFLFKDSENFSRLAITLWAITTLFTFISYRIAIRLLLSKARAKGRNNRKIAIVGAGKIGQHLATVVQQNDWLGYQIVGFYDDNLDIQKTINEISVVGTTDNILSDAKAGNFDEIYLCLPLRSEAKIKLMLNMLTDTAVVVKFIPDLFSFDLMHAKWTDLKGIPIVSVYDTPLNSTSSKLLKRMEDILLSSAILVFILPALVLISLGVKISSKGPIIFKQKRYGLNGKEILVYKFRSMTCQENGKEITQATKNDKRITAFGNFIRKTSLDELPQFFNVLQGTMSIVGPRPHANAHNEQYRKLVPKYMQRHLVKPGITGWAQINGWRGETDTLEKMEKRIEFDLHYIKNWSLWLDIRIITLTIVKGFINKNAY